MSLVNGTLTFTDSDSDFNTRYSDEKMETITNIVLDGVKTLDTINTIGKSLFEQCLNLTSIITKKPVTQIGNLDKNYVSYDKTKLTNNITKSYLFYNNSNLLGGGHFVYVQILQTWRLML